MPDLLTGTVTFLFTDIEGSTRLLAASLGDGLAAAARTRTTALLRARSPTHGGSEVGTEGDSFFVVFPSAPGAVGAGGRRPARPGG